MGLFLCIFAEPFDEVVDLRANVAEFRSRAVDFGLLGDELCDHPGFGWSGRAAERKRTAFSEVEVGKPGDIFGSIPGFLGYWVRYGYSGKVTVQDVFECPKVKERRFFSQPATHQVRLVDDNRSAWWHLKVDNVLNGLLKAAYDCQLIANAMNLPENALVVFSKHRADCPKITLSRWNNKLHTNGLQIACRQELDGLLCNGYAAGMAAFFKAFELLSSTMGHGLNQSEASAVAERNGGRVLLVGKPSCRVSVVDTSQL